MTDETLVASQLDISNTLRPDARTTDEEHFKLQLVQAEAERIKFLLRAYIRCRIYKVPKHKEKGRRGLRRC